MLARRVLHGALALTLASTAAVTDGGAASAEAVETERQVAQFDAAAPSRPAGEVTPATRTTGKPFVPKKPVWPTASSVTTSTSDVRVELVPEGEDRLKVRLDPAGAGGTVRVKVDYSAFRDAYGADWSSRLRLTGPGAKESSNNLTTGTVEAEVSLAAAGSTLTLAADESGPTGDYAATPLQASSTWEGGGNSGDFQWSYPMKAPPAVNGPVPTMSLAYSSGSMDGRMAASNNQPSWIGEGFELGMGSIERRFVPCAKDMAGGATNKTKSGDQCWRNDNATMTLNGKSTELIKGSDGRWHGRTEDGSRILKNTGAGNGDDDGEYWVVITTDGTEYWFGRNRLPGWESGGGILTESTWTVPVYGNHKDEPCYDDTFASARCDQAWRWNLDYVVDPFGNTMSMWYGVEKNAYARNMTRADVTAYERGGWLKRIDYGTRFDTAYGTAPMRVDFTVGPRCLANCGTEAKPEKENWPDTPWDLDCLGDDTCDNASPTFWTAKRLTTVTTRVGGQAVDSWSLIHSFPNPGDGSRAGLWLKEVGRTGHVGGTMTLPPVRFFGVQMHNRVDTTDFAQAMNWWRIAYIVNEGGGGLNVSYSDQECVRGGTMPDKDALHANNLRCFPVKWTPKGKDDPVLDYFHKYVVTAVTESDDGLAQDAQSTRAITTYTYLDRPAWRYTDDDGLVEDSLKTWSTWRGYGRVRVTKGEGSDAVRTETVYFRGLNGDKIPGGTRSVTLPAAGGAAAQTDYDELAGRVRESLSYQDSGGAEIEASVRTPWRGDATATRTIDGVTVTARFVGDAEVRARTALDGNRGWRRSTQKNTFDAYGLPTSSEDLGDDSVTDDQRCVITDYARNTTLWLMDFPSREREFAVDCTRARQTGLTEADVISDTYTRYDGGARGAAPTKGAVTAVEKLAGWPSRYITESSGTVDPHGRPKTAIDIRGVTTVYTYTPELGGPVAAVKQVRRINGIDWQATQTLNPAWGVPTEQGDANGKVIRQSYDALGRVTAVWKPNRIGKSASVTYTYNVRATGGSVVVTSTLHPSGTRYLTSYSFLDSLMRPRQTQAPEAISAGGRVLTDTLYDTAGRAFKKNGPVVVAGPPGETMERPQPDAEALGQTITEFDSAGRERAQEFRVRGVVRWRAASGFGGDRVDLTPAAGDHPTSTWTDAQGNTVRRRDYHGALGSTGYTDTTYRYNRKGQLDQVRDAAGNIWSYGYDLLGRKISVDDPDLGQSSATYTDQGDMRTSTDAEGQTLWSDYDVLGRKTAMREGSATGRLRAAWRYDAIGTTLWLGQKVGSVRYERDPATGREYEYVDAVGGFTNLYQPTTRTVTIPDSQPGLAGNYSYVYGYTESGEPATTRMPGVGGLPGETLTVAYDDFGRPKTLSTNVSSTGDNEFLVNGTGYTRFGELSLIGRRSGTSRWLDTGYTYEEGTRRLSRALTTRETVPALVADVRYDRDAAGNITAIRDVATNDNQCFTHDYAQRLVESWTPADGDCAVARRTQQGLGGPAAYWHSYEYDAIGNRTRSVERTGTTSVERTYRYPAAGADQPHALQSMQTVGGGTATYTYDRVGRTVTRPADGLTGAGQALTWDMENHLATSTDSDGAGAYVYDANGNRLVRREGGVRTLYLPDQEVKLVAGQPAAGTRYIQYAGQTVAVRTITGLQWQVNDQQGTGSASVRVADQAVTVRRQTPFGGDRGAAVAWPTERGFVGGTKDAGTGLTHIGAREYDPVIGRFVSVDPIIDVNDPDQMHGYNYSDASPILFSDPDGLWKKDPAEGGGGQSPQPASKPQAREPSPMRDPTLRREYYRRKKARDSSPDQHWGRSRECTMRNPCTTRRPKFQPIWGSNCGQQHCRTQSGWVYSWMVVDTWKVTLSKGWNCLLANGCIEWKPPPPPKKGKVKNFYFSLSVEWCFGPGGPQCYGLSHGEKTNGDFTLQVTSTNAAKVGGGPGFGMNLAASDVGAERAGTVTSGCAEVRVVEGCFGGGVTTDTGEPFVQGSLGPGRGFGGGVTRQESKCVWGCEPGESWWDEIEEAGKKD